MSVSIGDAFDTLRRLEGRTPHTAGEVDWAKQLAEYRDGAVYIAHWSGASEWERHGAGDEIVMALEGRATLFVLQGDEEVPHLLTPNTLFIVPQGRWHRFESAEGVKLLTVTPQPTDHSAVHPGTEAP